MKNIRLFLGKRGLRAFIEIKGKDTYTYHNIDYKVVPDKAKSMLKKLKL